MSCPSCGETNVSGAKFCSFCGAYLLAEPGSGPRAQPKPTPLPATIPDDPSVEKKEHDADTIEGVVSGRVLVGRYRVEQRLGSGGMGEVWRAIDLELELPVALKLLPPMLARNSRSLSALKREATLLLRLTHPNICRLYTFHADEGMGILVMELVDGPTLEHLLEQAPNHSLTLPEVMPLFRGIGEALYAAHRQEPPILHRDIKPGNIMKTPSGQPKLMDFGIAREIKDTLTRSTGQDVAGTLLYMSPEQFLGKRLTPAADLYSLAATLYECLSGRPPFHTGAIAHQLLQVPPESLRVQGMDISERIDAVLLKALAKQPAERFDSVQQFLKALDDPAPMPQVVATASGVPPSLVVAQEGSADYRSIAEAVRYAVPGSRILVRSGRYVESLILDRKLEIAGDGLAGEVVIESADAPAMQLHADVTLRNLSFAGKHRGVEDDVRSSAALLVSEGRPLLEGCVITSKKTGVVVAGVMAVPTLRGCKVHSCGGVLFMQEAQGTLENCELFDNKGSGVAVLRGASPTVRRCKVRDGKGAGVSVSDQGTGVFEDCDISGNQLAGVVIRDYGDPLVRRCKVHDSRTYPGVSVTAGGKGTIEDCEIYGNRSAGVAIRQGGHPTVRRCRIHNQPDQGGVLVSDQGLGVLEDCDVYGNKLAGIIIKDGGNPTVRRCEIHDSRTHPGVWVWSNGQGTIEDCHIYGNKLAGVEVKEGGHPKVIGCRINRNNFHGIHVHTHGEATVTNCDLSLNMFGPWNISSTSQVQQDGNRG